jgi:hypothetical protein
MIEDIYPFPLVGWLAMLVILLSCPAQYRAIRYGITLAWLFFGAGGVDELRLSRFPPWLSGPIPLLSKLLGPGPSRASRIVSKYLPAFILWIDLPLHLGFGHPNVSICAAGFAIVFLVQWGWGGGLITVASS